MRIMSDNGNGSTTERGLEGWGRGEEEERGDDSGKILEEQRW